jgi:RNA polymerase primary sigma factor
MINLPEVTEENYNNYINKISKFPVLSTEDEQAKLLIASINDINDISDINATNSLLCSYMRFVISVANKYKDKGLDMSELVNLGNKGLLKAIKSYYNEHEGERFIKVLVRLVDNEIRKEFK